MDNILRCPKCGNKYMLQHKVAAYAEQHVLLPGHEYPYAQSTPQEYFAKFCILECAVCGYKFDSNNVAYSLDYKMQSERTQLMQSMHKYEDPKVAALIKRIDKLESKFDLLEERDKKAVLADPEKPEAAAADSPVKAKYERSKRNEQRIDKDQDNKTE